MSIKAFRFAGFLFAAAALLVMSAVQAATFTTLEQAQPSDTPGKVEVLEFFSYTCPHCNAIEPLVDAWRKDLPEAAVFKGVPVAFNASMRDQQKLYYALEAMDRLDLHPLVFKAIHSEHIDLYNENEITNWVVKQGLDRDEFTDVFNSFGVQTRAARANELAKAYEIESTPSFAVAGRYITSPAQAGGYQQAIDETDRLLSEALAGD